MVVVQSRVPVSFSDVQRSAAGKPLVLPLRIGSGQTTDNGATSSVDMFAISNSVWSLLASVAPACCPIAVSRRLSIMPRSPFARGRAIFSTGHQSEKAMNDTQENHLIIHWLPLVYHQPTD